MRKHYCKTGIFHIFELTPFLTRLYAISVANISGLKAPLIFSSSICKEQKLYRYHTKHNFSISKIVKGYLNYRK